MIKIVLPSPNDNSRLGYDTKVLNSDGAEIKHIKRIQLDLQPNRLIEAVVTLNISEVENFEAHPLLSMESLESAAARYGYALTKIE